MKITELKILFSMTSILLAVSPVFSQNSVELPTRDKIDPKYTWNLRDIYATDELWEKDFKWVDENYNTYKSYEGKLAISAVELLKGLKFDEEISIKIGKLYLYASCSKNLDLGNSTNMARFDRINQLNTKVNTAGSFLRPELLSIPKEKIDQYFKESKDLKIYEHEFDALFRAKEHILPKEQEELLSMASEVNQVPENTFEVFTNAELPFTIIKDPEGNDQQLSEGRYYGAIYSTNREYRERAYHAFYKPYKQFSNTLAALFNGQVKTSIFNSKARKFHSSLEAALDANNIPVSVYNNLISAVDSNLGPLHRWIRLRKKVLALSDIHPYDFYVTLFPNSKKEYDYEKAKKIVNEALKPLGEEYLKNLNFAFDNRWLDVYETKGKMGGAHSTGTTFGTHPYVLLNWSGQLNDVFTLAHEMGHNMHSLYTEKTQPYPYADYSIFVAEVASTCNEALLLDYLIQNASTKEEKLALLEKYISNINSTLYRQTMFAEFEKAAHEKVEKGEALTAELLTALYKGIVDKYLGPDMVIDEEETYTWARIPHFYYNFYVYQYATSFAASQVLIQKIKEEKQPAIDRYLTFLKSGSSDYPINILKKSGVDMSSPEPVIKTLKKMDELMDEMEKLLNE